jgi:hypothetical protein
LFGCDKLEGGPNDLEKAQFPKGKVSSKRETKRFLRHPAESLLSEE